MYKRSVVVVSNTNNNEQAQVKLSQAMVKTLKQSNNQT